jgi:small-conductance mechanosensitive channel
MIRLFARVLIMLMLIAAGAVQAAAADQGSVVVPTSTASTSNSSANGVTPAQAAQVLDVLNDPTKRAAFSATLQAIVKGLPTPDAPATSTTAASTPAKPAAATSAPARPAAGTKPSTASPIRLAPDSIGARALMGASSLLRHSANQALQAVTTLRGVPEQGQWLASLVSDPTNRARVLDVAWRIALAVGCGLLAEWLIRLILRRPTRALEMRTPDLPTAGSGHLEAAVTRTVMTRTAVTKTLAVRVPIVLARLMLALVPVLGFVIVGHVLAGGVLGGESLAQLAVLAVIDAYALSAAILRTARLFLTPPRPGLRLFAIAAPVAVYAMGWLRLMVVVTVGGYALAQLGLLFGLSEAAYLDLLDMIVLFDHACLAVIVFQQRQTVRDKIRAPTGATGTWASLRNGLAGTWHWIALTVLAALWLVSASEVPGGYARILYIFLVTGVVALVAWVVRMRAVSSVAHALHVQPDLSTRYPGLEMRLNRYHPVVQAIADAMVYLVAALVLLQLWGLDAFGWLFISTPGRQLLSTVVTVLVTVLLALLVWEAAEAVTERRLARLATQGQNARAARLRTLLPMLRTTLLIVILLVAGLMVLSAIGVNTAPMLAGAGIVGLAIGFGSQKLVQDVITGIFLLLENAMQIGDAVTVAGLSGTVEALSVRTIRLRAGDGSVHLIPFSSVTSVTNTNRGLGNASVNVSVAYAEDTDRLCNVLTEIAAQMRAEPEFSSKMLGDLEIWGVDKVDGAEATIAGQIVCTDAGRWGVQREFNRRMKKRLQELDIELFNPLRMLLLRGDAASQPPTETGGAS